MNKIGDKGVIRFTVSLERKNSLLESLNLSHCGITKDGLFYLLNSIKTNGSLLQLTLNYNNL